MYRLNPLHDETAPITPAQIMYRLDNIHQQLQHMDKVSKTTAAVKQASPVKMTNGAPEEKKKVEKKPETKSKSPTKAVSSASPGDANAVLAQMDASIASLKALRYFCLS